MICYGNCYWVRMNDGCDLFQKQSEQPRESIHVTIGAGVQRLYEQQDCLIELPEG